MLRGLFGNKRRQATGMPMDMSPTAQIMPGDQPTVDQRPNPFDPSGAMQPQQRGMDEKLFALGGLIANLGGVQNNAAGEYMGMRRAREAQQQQAAAQQQQMQQSVAALVQQGVPEQQARIIAQGGGADALLSKYYEPKSQNPTSLQQNYEWLRQTNPQAADAYLERMTNNYEYRQGADGRFYRIDIAEPQVLGDTLPQGWTIEGGGSGNAAGGFRP